jgi:hypothetical protein
MIGMIGIGIAIGHRIVSASAVSKLIPDSDPDSDADIFWLKPCYAILIVGCCFIPPE